MSPPAEDTITATAKMNLQKRFCHPKLSRWRMLGLMSLSMLFVVFLAYHYASSMSLERPEKNVMMLNAAASYNITTMGANADVVDRIRYKHTNRQLPGCIIIGARKAGTRALLNYLNLHPDIMTAKNEVHFFDDDENYKEGLEWYRKKMPYSFPGQITVEKTPAYFVTRGVPERVFSMNSTVKFLLVVRDPTARAVSDYLQIYLHQVQKYGHGPSFESLAMDRYGEVDNTYQPIKRSIYHRFMMRWLEHFPLNQFHIISAEQLVKDPYPEVRKIETFLELPHRIRPDMFYYNETRKFFCIRNEDFHKCLNETKGRKHPDLPPWVLRALREFYAPFNRDFYFVVKQDFGWPEH